MMKGGGNGCVARVGRWWVACAERKGLWAEVKYGACLGGGSGYGMKKGLMEVAGVQRFGIA